MLSAKLCMFAVYELYQVEKDIIWGIFSSIKHLWHLWVSSKNHWIPMKLMRGILVDVLLSEVRVW